MIPDSIRLKINEYVDEYICETRLEFFYLERHREIKQVDEGAYIVTDSDLIIDLNDIDLGFLVHPEENLFIPEYATNFVVDYSISLILPNLELSNFEVIGIASENLISLSDSRFTEDQLLKLVEFTCFDLTYQKQNPSVSKYLSDIYSRDQSQHKQMVLNRLRPLLFP